ncbi:MAG: ABC transporter permease [Nocardiopsaceae bacterium]|nr:ABC transporter permease [Nocardiopsaceae bacterium]
MLRTTLAGLRMHKGRLVTTALAIILGVTFVAGTLVFTDTMGQSIEKQAMGSATSVDVLVTPEDPEQAREDGESPLGADTVAAIKELAETGAVQGIITGDAPLLDKDGKAVGDMPSAGMTISGAVDRYEPSEGRLPESDSEIILSTQLARSAEYQVGDTARVLDHNGEKHSLEVVGLVDFGLDGEAAYRGAVGFTPEMAEAITGVDHYSEINVLGAEGVPDEDLKSAIAGVVGDDIKAWTGQEYGEEIAENYGFMVQTYRVGFMAFAAVAVFVASLVIFNTFAILIAQRQREMAMLRCVGATRRQVFRSVLGEAALIGLVASALGVAAGAGAGVGGIALIAQYDSLMAAASPVISPTTIIIGMLVGTLVTLVSALLPAVRATRVAPLTALRTSAASNAAKENRIGWVRISFGLLFVLASVGTVAFAMSLEPGELPMIIVVGAGLVCFIGVMFVSPLLVRALTTLVGWPLRMMFGVATGLAVENAQRSPKRAATAMIALTVGVTLISGFSVISASLQTTMDRQLDEEFPVDYLVHGQMTEQGSTGVPPKVAEELRDAPGIATVYTERVARTEVGGEAGKTVGTMTGSGFEADIEESAIKGSLDGLAPDTTAINEAEAEEIGAGVGDTVSIAADSGALDVEIVALLNEQTTLPPILLDQETFTSAFPEADTDQNVYVKVADGAALSDVRTEVEDAIADHPTVSISSATQLKEQYDQNMRSVFYVIAALLALAIIIAIFGIANTMALSVLERTRESALLRALGLAKSQLRRMLSVEAILVAVIGALLGVGLGILFGWAASQVMMDDMAFSLPVLQVLSFIAVAIVAGLLSGVLPSRRAAKTSITGALASE